jgi:hypothetical protein
MRYPLTIPEHGHYVCSLVQVFSMMRFGRMAITRQTGQPEGTPPPLNLFLARVSPQI